MNRIEAAARAYDMVCKLAKNGTPDQEGDVTIYANEDGTNPLWEEVKAIAAAIPKHSVTILWGEAPEEGDEPKTYTFATRAELDAFLLGVVEMEGWMDWRFIEPGYRWDYDQREAVPIEGETE